MSSFSPPSAGKTVTIHTSGVGEPVWDLDHADLSPGGWAAVLTSGNHVREIHGCKWRTTDNRMGLLAVIKAVESLKWPVTVRIWAAEGAVREGVGLLLADRESPRPAWRGDGLLEGIDLWVRLAAAVRPHEVEWAWIGPGSAEPGCIRAAELAREELQAARFEVPGEVAWSSQEFPPERRDTLARLAVTVAELKDRHPLVVWDHLQSAIAEDESLPQPVTSLIEEMESGAGNGWGSLDSLFSIMRDPDLSQLLLPSLRRPRRSEAATYRIRVDLRETKPPVWRRLELASDLYLDEVHKILQVAFDWTGAHLHMFSSGVSAYSRDAEEYLCPYEASEGKVGIPEEEVRLDEVLVDAGDKLHYLYDFGDGWTYRIRLEAILPRDESVPLAACTAGRRAGPEEDCGGTDAYESMVKDDTGSDTFTADDVKLINDRLSGFERGDTMPDWEEYA
jgi:ribonuclease HI